MITIFQSKLIIIQRKQKTEDQFLHKLSIKLISVKKVQKLPFNNPFFSTLRAGF